MAIDVIEVGGRSLQVGEEPGGVRVWKRNLRRELWRRINQDYGLNFFLI